MSIDLVVALLLVVSGVAWLAALSVRARRGLKLLTAEKDRRLADRHAEGDQGDLLFLLSDDEKKSLLSPSGVIPKWLGKRQMSELSPYEASWYAGFLRSRMRTWRFVSLVTAAIGSLILSRYFFPTFDNSRSLVVTPDDHVLAALAGSTWHAIVLSIPFLIGFGSIAAGLVLKERSDDYEEYAKVLEDKAKSPNL